MIPDTPPGLVPIANKQGEFFGFADEDQVRKHGLKVYDANANAPTKQASPAPKAEEKPASKGSDPGRVRRAPPAPKKAT